jgi:hypothetical protein
VQPARYNHHRMTKSRGHLNPTKVMYTLSGIVKLEVEVKSGI